MVVMETITFVFFDISSDRIRDKVGEVCKDFGLVRFQYSGFIGRLNKNMRESLYIKLLDIIDENEAKVVIQTVCEKCFENALIIGEFKTDNEIPEIEVKGVWDLPYNYPVIEE